MVNGFKGIDEFNNYIKAMENFVRFSFWRLGD